MYPEAVRSKELKMFNILRAYELKFEPNIGCRTKTSSKMLTKISLVGVKISYFSLKVGSKELNHAATGDLKSSGKGWKGGLDCQTYPYHLLR